MDSSTGVLLCGDLNLLRCFHGTSIPIVVASWRPDEVTFRSRDCHARQLITNPAEDPSATVRDLERAAIAIGGRPMLVYGDDAMLLAVSRNRERLARTMRFLLPDNGLIETLVDKNAFAALAARLGLPAPRTVVARDIDRPDQILRELELPIVFKPGNHIGWQRSAIVREHGGLPRKMLRADDRRALFRIYEDMLAHTSDFVVQEYVPGGDDAIYSVHAYVDAKRRPLAHFVGRKIRTYPRDSGVSTFIELTEDPALLRLGLDVLDRLGFVGIGKLDFKRHARTGRPYLLEINPRFNLWHRLGAAAGVNLPLCAYADWTGQPMRGRERYRTDVRWLAFGDDLRTFVREYRAAGDLTWSQWLASLRGPKVFDVFSWRDPFPFATTGARFVRDRCGKVARRLRRSDS